MLLAYAGLPAILALVPPGTIPDESEIALNAPVLIFTLGALRADEPSSAAWRRRCTARGATSRSRCARRAAGLAGSSQSGAAAQGARVAEVALSLMLLVGSSLLVRTFVAMQNVDLGCPARSDPDDARAAGGRALSGCRPARPVLQELIAEGERRAGRRGRRPEHGAAPVRQHAGLLPMSPVPRRTPIR